ncbi:MAG: ROK family protein [Clostridium sp.]|uniref:ROK family protein n=1 Tax=Clostridium sp. TaxID=1506 RepID=UPI002914BD79|nr:ROK family protein [Clostridium sp.]MDU5741194.1 ROK family protein [Clostridium sp.]MDU5785326.1 ROK family protein [Clostridium sp.]
MSNYIVFDIGGSSVKWSIMSKMGDILTKDKIKVVDSVDQFFEELSKIVNINKDNFNLKGIAISSPGAVDSITGIVGGASAIPYIHGPNFKEILKEKTGLDVAIENDANCAALGECWLGAAKEENDCAFVVCGSGIGGAIVKDKKVHTGIHKHGGEFGYCIVDYDKDGEEKYLTWSRVGSTSALARAISQRKGLEEKDIDGLKAFQLYDEGDIIAVEEVNKYFRYMAIGIYNIQYTYDPEVIVLGGAISEREGYIESINEKLDEIMSNNTDGKIKPIIKKCAYGNDANMIGALYNLLNER